MDVKIDLKSLKAKFSKNLVLVREHATFAAILLVLIAYLFVVWQISHLATAEPAQDSVPTSDVPKVDKKAIQQIQALEKNNIEVHSLFNAARNNPFQE